MWNSLYRGSKAQESVHSGFKILWNFVGVRKLSSFKSPLTYTFEFSCTDIHHVQNFSTTTQEKIILLRFIEKKRGPKIKIFFCRGKSKGFEFSWKFRWRFSEKQRQQWKKNVVWSCNSKLKFLSNLQVILWGRRKRKEIAKLVRPTGRGRFIGKSLRDGSNFFSLFCEKVLHS